MTPQELKASILQLAIQGKLVEQLPTETLSESIAANALDRNREDIPFEIPDTWCWCYLEDIATLHNGRAYKKPEMLKNGKYPLLRVGNLFTSDTWYYSDMELEPEKYCDNGDLLYAWSASFGPHIWNGGKVIYHYHIWKVELRHPQMRDYLYWALAAQTDAIKRRGHGLTMIHITKAGTEKMLIPVPPIAEQKRIVAKIEELLPLIDRYEQAWSALEAFNARFPVDMQKSILQMAIQGKLVPQLPEEGTGEELFLQIQAEKQALIKAGTIKKEKPLPEITEDEIPFDIPNTWEWVRLDDVVTKSIKRGKSPTYTAKSGTLVFAQKCNTKAGYIYLDIALYLDESKLDRYPVEEFMQDQDIVINSTGNGTLGRVGMYRDTDNPRNLPIVPDSHVTVIRVNKSVSAKYVYYVLKHYQPYMEKLGTGSTNQTELSASVVRSLLFPLPPLAEQKRIVAKLEEILPLCEQLK